jgi:outer membrane protein OmpA-like peptidoglycan-associated protein
LAQKDPAATSGGQDAAREGTTPSKAARKPPANCPRQLRPLAQPVYFKTDAASISSEDRARLQRLGECLGRARVRIVGHADPRHTDEYNQELSERRARAVAGVLTDAGADPARVAVVGAGKTQASSKKPSRQALQRARRVDIQIR